MQQKPFNEKMQEIMPFVVNMRFHEPYDVRIDRRSNWGNPFRIDKACDRREAVRRFFYWLMSDDGERAEFMRDHLLDLRGLTLGCWCAPAFCHGHVLAALANGISPLEVEEWLNALPEET